MPGGSPFRKLWNNIKSIIVKDDTNLYMEVEPDSPTARKSVRKKGGADKMSLIGEEFPPDGYETPMELDRPPLPAPRPPPPLPARLNLRTPPSRPRISGRKPTPTPRQPGVEPVYLEVF